MKLNRSTEVLVACLFACFSATLSLKPEDTVYKLHEPSDDHEHEIQRRAIRIYSKPPGEGAEIYMGWNPRKHADNVLQGGKIGLEVDTDRFTRKFSPIWNGLKRFRESRKRKWAERHLPVDFPDKKSPDDVVPEEKEPDVFPEEKSPGDDFPEDRDFGDDPDVDFDPRKLFPPKKDWQRLIECENAAEC